MNSVPAPPFREAVIGRFVEVLGPSEQAAVSAGVIHRWTLRRPPYGISMFITIDSPEFLDIAHIMISDGLGHQVEPVVALTIRTMPEAEALLERILTQWRSQGRS